MKVPSWALVLSGLSGLLGNQPFVGGQLEDAVASAPSLSIPVSCAFGGGPEKCHIAFYPDHDATQGMRDYQCGARTYNAWSSKALAHRGTDFAVLDASALKGFKDGGPAALAAADGVVKATRRGLTDTYEADPKSQKACGNRVIIDHGAGWHTDYCHLAQGSLQVRAGDIVKAGQKIATIGTSGNANFIHLHFTLVYQDGTSGEETAYDPFSGTPLGEADCKNPKSMWTVSDRLKMPYRPVRIVKNGFTDKQPRTSLLIRGQRNKSSLVWDRYEPIFGFLYALGLTKGMTVQLAIVSEKGERLAGGTKRVTDPKAADVISLNLREANQFKDFLLKKGRAPLGKLTLFTRVLDQNKKILAEGRAMTSLIVSESSQKAEQP